MVPRAELLAAQSEAKANKEEALAKAADLERTKAQVSAAREEAAKLQSAMGAMVSKGELEAARGQLRQAEDAAREEGQRQREALAALTVKLGSVEAEKAPLASEMKVPFSLVPLLLSLPSPPPPNFPSPLPVARVSRSPPFPLPPLSASLLSPLLPLRPRGLLPSTTPPPSVPLRP